MDKIFNVTLTMRVFSASLLQARLELQAQELKHLSTQQGSTYKEYHVFDIVDTENMFRPNVHKIIGDWQRENEQIYK